MGKNKLKKKPVRYYHGGFPGLVPGVEILPYEKTAISLRSGYISFDPKRVFVTTSLELATAYALSFARRAPKLLPNYNGPAEGSVYAVDVKGPKIPDEDFVELAPSRGGHFSFSVIVPPVITHVITGNLPADPPREHRLVAPFETWESPDGKIYPIWDQDGFVLPNPADAKRGITGEMLEQHFRMGPFPGKDALIRNKLYSN